jgi:hypothetical protein
MVILKAQPYSYSSVLIVLGSAPAIVDLVFFFELRLFRDGGGDSVWIDAL